MNCLCVEDYIRGLKFPKSAGTCEIFSMLRIEYFMDKMLMSYMTDLYEI